VTFFWFSV